MVEGTMMEAVQNGIMLMMAKSHRTRTFGNSDGGLSEQKGVGHLRGSNPLLPTNKTTRKNIIDMTSREEFLKIIRKKAEANSTEVNASGTTAAQDTEGKGDILDRMRTLCNTDVKEKQHHTAHEEEMQMRIVRLMGDIYPQYADLLVHNANEFHGTIKQGARRKRLGVRKGFPDFSFFMPSKYYHGLHIELKYGRNGQSQEQKEYQKRLEGVGYQYVVCRSEEDFIKGMNQYILLGRWGAADEAKPRKVNYLETLSDEG